MSFSARNDPDHNLNTLTDVLRLLGDSRKDIKRVMEHQSEHDRRFDQQDKRFDQQDKRFDQHDRRFDQQDKRFDQQDEEIAGLRTDNAEIKETLALILSRLPAN